MTTTPIDRLREQHASCVVPCFIHAWVGDRPHCGECTYAWPCDVIAALDALERQLAEHRELATNMRELHDQLDDENEALQARLDAATELIKVAAVGLHSSHAVRGTSTIYLNPPATCAICAPYRAWLAENAAVGSPEAQQTEKAP